MTKKSHLSEENQKRLASLRQQARRRLAKRGIVQFRADEEMLDLLVRVADHKRKPMGVMVREWVTARLADEARSLPLPDIRLPNGLILSEKSPQVEIEKAVIDHQQGLIQLADQEYRTLMDWLLDRHLAAKYGKG